MGGGIVVRAVRLHYAPLGDISDHDNDNENILCDH